MARSKDSLQLPACVELVHTKVRVRVSISDICPLFILEVFIARLYKVLAYTSELRQRLRHKGQYIGEDMNSLDSETTECCANRNLFTRHEVLGKSLSANLFPASRTATV
jgi:hypothetical protein